MGPPKYKINQSIYILAQTTTYSTSFVSYSLAPHRFRKWGQLCTDSAKTQMISQYFIYYYHVLSRSIFKPLIFNSHVSSMCPKSKKRNKINSQAKWYFIRLVSFRSPSHLQQPQKAPDNDRSIKTEMKRNIIDHNATLTIFSVYYKKKNPVSTLQLRGHINKAKYTTTNYIFNSNHMW